MSANLAIQFADANTVGAVGVSIAYDYSPYYERIASALENIAYNVDIATSLIGSVANTSSSIQTNISILTTEATGNGIHMLSPYSWIPMISIYKSMVEQAGILTVSDANPPADSANQALALATMNSYIDKVRAFPII